MARILIVEDERDIRESLRDALVERNYDVDIAENASEALALEKSTQHDVAVVDFVLPGKAGLELVRELRKVNPFIKAVIISGQIDHDELDPEELERQLKAKVEADRYLAKPVPIERLVEAIQEISRPLLAEPVDWKRVATDVVAARKVKAKDVKNMERELRKTKKKRKK